MKKLLSVLMTCIMGATLLTGCGSETVETNDNSKEISSDAEQVEITFWDNYADTIHKEVYEKIIEDFETENPEIKVQYVPLPSDQSKSKYDVAIQSGSTPDCGVIYQYMVNEYVLQDALLPLDNYYGDSNMLVDVFVESMRSMVPDGQLYSLPFNYVSSALWYNTELFKKAELDPPTNWDEVFEDAKILTDKSNGVYGFSLRGGAGSSQQLETMLYQYSGITEMFDENGKSTINDPLHVEFLEKFISLYNVYTPESDITNASTEMLSAFDSGSAAMIYHNMGSYGQHRDTLGDGAFGAVIDFKAKDGSSVMASNGTVSLSVFKNSEHPDEAYKFISYLVGHTANSIYNEKLGSIPCNKEALEDAWVQESVPVKAAVNMLLDPNTKVAILPGNIPGYFDLHSNTLAAEFQNVLLGNESAQEYLDNWAERMTALKKAYDENVVTE